MPYIKKSDLENMLRNAFGQGFWSAMAVDHEDVSLHIKQEADFQEYLEELKMKHKKF
ncbi:hypothetical protein [Paenibacillus glucanolyticus]|uniref:hypothetical protein n=1 Tax=Paenibacillus glucanolyticus TaxID=59843 RepID=UPI0015C3FD4D|nr:hypothetical protein [Paenibacillus glucanolyticus]